MSLDAVAAAWTALGEADPLWAVLVSPEHRNGRWDVRRFLETGRTETAAVLQQLAELGLPAARTDALDFGCGAGRLSQALAAHFDSVIGLDISEPMLVKARELDVAGLVDFRRNDQPNLATFDDEAFDLVMSSLVLQHLPAELAGGYLTEMLRVCRPGGAVVVQVASRPNWSPKGILFRFAPRPLLRFAQHRLLHYPAPMDMNALSPADVHALARAAGARIVEQVAEPMYGGHWHYTRYYLTKP
jgi:SAM-dependent methyltransferase